MPSHLANPDSAQKICLFGGTFDPIHLGHTTIAQQAVESLGLDRVLFIPCRQSPHKADRQATDPQHRLAMCQLATRELPWATVDDFELTNPPPSYAWITAGAIARRHPQAELFWLMGTDQWNALPRWAEPDQLARLLTFLVFSRGEAAQARPGFKMIPIPGQHPAAATAIRESLQSGQNGPWLNPEVSRYIQSHQLYQTPAHD